MLVLYVTCSGVEIVKDDIHAWPNTPAKPSKRPRREAQLFILDH